MKAICTKPTAKKPSYYYNPKKYRFLNHDWEGKWRCECGTEGETNVDYCIKCTPEEERYVEEDPNKPISKLGKAV